MASISPAMLGTLGGVALCVAVVGAGYYMISIMSAAPTQTVVASSYPTDVIQKELLKSGGVFDRAASLVTQKASSALYVPVTVNNGELGKTDLTIYE